MDRTGVSSGRTVGGGAGQAVLGVVRPPLKPVQPYWWTWAGRKDRQSSAPAPGQQTPSLGCSPLRLHGNAHC